MLRVWGLGFRQLLPSWLKVSLIPSGPVCMKLCLDSGVPERWGFAMEGSWEVHGTF